MTEFGFIDRIKDLFATLPDNGFEGIGDDCAILPVGGGESLVFTTDMLAEGVHFLRAATSSRELGRNKQFSYLFIFFILTLAKNNV